MLSDPGGRPDLSVEHSLTIWFELTDGMTLSDGKTYGAVYLDSVPADLLYEHEINFFE